MSASQVLDHIVSTLRDGGAFGSVSLGDDPADTATPRACVTLTTLASGPLDDRADCRWQRVEAIVSVLARSDSPGGAIKRALSLYDHAAEALLQDPTRGGLCQDVPVGAATVVLGPQADSRVALPFVRLNFAVHCHLEL